MEMLSRIKIELDCHAACGVFDRNRLLLATANGINLGHENSFVTIRTLDEAATAPPRMVSLLHTHVEARGRSAKLLH